MYPVSYFGSFHIYSNIWSPSQLAEGGHATVTLNTVNDFSSDILRMTYDANRLMIPLLRRKSFTTTTRPREGQRERWLLSADAKKTAGTPDHENRNLYMYASVDGVL